MSPKLPPPGVLLDVLPDAICVVDAEGRFLFVSEGFRRIFGYAPEEVIGRSTFELVHPADRVHDADQPTEPDLDVPVDADPGRLFEGLREERGPALGEGGVDLAHAVTGDVEGRVTRHGDQRGGAVAGVQEQDRVGELALRVPGAQALALLRRETSARVAADQEVRRAGLVAGAVTVTAALMLAVYAIVNGNEQGWTSARTLGILGAAAAGPATERRGVAGAATTLWGSIAVSAV